MEIVKLKINQVIPYENNAKLHPKEQIEQIKNSIIEFGNNDPIAIDENYIVIEGHGRLKALKQLGYEEVECIILSGLNEDQKNAYRLVHNQLTMNSGWDMTKLKEELSAINVDMSKLGMDINLLNQVEDENIEVEEDNFDLDETLNNMKEIYVKPGDIYQLGKHYLMCGDTTSKADVEKLMDGVKADLLVIDPPYNINVSNSQGMTIAHDNMEKNDFINFLTSSFDELNSSLKEGGAFYIWYADTSVYEFLSACKNVEWQVRENLIWIKSQFILGRQDYQWRHEPCLYGWKEGASHYFVNDRTQSTIIDDSIDLDTATEETLRDYIKSLLNFSTVIYEKKPTVNDIHPTMKPLRLIGKLIKNSSKKNEIVLDGFGGSGSTLIACEELNRTCYTMEYEPKYAQAIIERWEQLTNGKAVRL